jgi:hypothetical protein
MNNSSNSAETLPVIMSDDEETIGLKYQAERIDVGFTDKGQVIVALSDLDSFVVLNPDELEEVVEALIQAYQMVMTPEEDEHIH